MSEADACAVLLVVPAPDGTIPEDDLKQVTTATDAHHSCFMHVLWQE